MTIETLAAVVSAFAALASLFVGLFVVWMRRRETLLRSGEVLAWANEVIRVLETLLLIVVLRESKFEPAEIKSKITELIIDTAVLVERGRIFFKNAVFDSHGSKKEPAYRGYRPIILDQIVVAHLIACRWDGADDDTKLRMHLLAEQCLKKFVSLVQKEVGRERTVSADTRLGGDGANLERLLAELDEQRLNRLRAKRA